MTNWILLIEDSIPDSDLFQLTARSSAVIDYVAVIGSEGEDALSYLYEIEDLPNVIVTDLNLPGQPGLDFIRALRADPDLASLPVIALSGSDDPAIASASIEAGADAFVNKARGLGGFSEAIVAAEKMIWANPRITHP